MVCDELARRHGGSYRSKFSGDLAELRLDGARVALLKPQTYMNESGRRSGRRCGSSRFRPNSCSSSTTRSISTWGASRRGWAAGLAGHNGLRSVAQQLGTPEFMRLRIGVGRPERGDPRPVADWVLTPVPPGGRRRGARGASGRCGRDDRRRGARRGAAAIQRAAVAAGSPSRHSVGAIRRASGAARLATLTLGALQPPTGGSAERSPGTKEGGPPCWRTTRRRCSARRSGPTPVLLLPSAEAGSRP